MAGVVCFIEHEHPAVFIAQGIYSAVGGNRGLAVVGPVGRGGRRGIDRQLLSALEVDKIEAARLIDILRRRRGHSVHVRRRRHLAHRGLPVRWRGPFAFFAGPIGRYWHLTVAGRDPRLRPLTTGHLRALPVAAYTPATIAEAAPGLHSAPVHGAAEHTAGRIAEGSGDLLQGDSLLLIADLDRIALAKGHFRAAEDHRGEGAGDLPGEKRLPAAVKKGNLSPGRCAAADVIQD